MLSMFLVGFPDERWTNAILTIVGVVAIGYLVAAIVAGYREQKKLLKYTGSVKEIRVEGYEAWVELQENPGRQFKVEAPRQELIRGTVTRFEVESHPGDPIVKLNPPEFKSIFAPGTKVRFEVAPREEGDGQPVENVDEVLFYKLL